MIDVRNISKTYHVTKKEEGIRGVLKSLVTKETVELKAVNNISFHVDKGEIVGFIGPNGAGKSTTIKMMSGILTPTSGQVLIAGEDITKHRKEVVQNIGVVFGQRTQLNWDLRLSESFELLRHIYRVDKEDYMNVLDTMDEILGIKELLCKPVRQMSLGQRIKGDLVAAMIHSPKVLFLDEPTIGLDVSSKYALRTFQSRKSESRRSFALHMGKKSSDNVFATNFPVFPRLKSFIKRKFSHCDSLKISNL